MTYLPLPCPGYSEEYQLLHFTDHHLSGHRLYGKSELTCSTHSMYIRSNTCLISFLLSQQLQELQPLMAHPDLQSEHGSSAQDQTKEKEPVQPARPTALQRARKRFLKGISYFSGDMKAFGKWMESKLMQMDCYRMNMT